MEKYKVLYIDEQEEEREIFESLKDDSLEIETVHPYPTQEEMMRHILEDKYDAVIVDYGLMKEDARVKYKGDDIINRINDAREDFPALIFTQDITQDDGVDEKVPSTKILLKDDLDIENPEPFQRKIKSYIRFYKKENERLSYEFNELSIKKRKDKLSDSELERLNYLDQKLERRLHGKREFPNLLKNSETLQHLNELIKDADELLKKKLKK